MSNRSTKKMRHREDVKPMPSFKERAVAGTKGLTVCPNPFCRELTDKPSKFPSGVAYGCDKCAPMTHLSAPVEDVQVAEEVEHVHGEHCDHDHTNP